MTDLKFCKDCKWCRPDIMDVMERIFTLGFSDGLKFAKCARPKDVDLVSGKQQNFYCSTERLFDCGEDAQYYEAKLGEEMKCWLIATRRPKKTLKQKALEDLKVIKKLTTSNPEILDNIEKILNSLLDSTT